MADTKVSALTAATLAAGIDEVPINQSGTSKRLTLSLLRAFTEQIGYASRATNTILAAADLGLQVDASAAFTQTLTAAATLGAGWWCIVRNATTDGTSLLVVDPNAGELIDGLATITMYSGDTRLIVCTGGAFVTTLLHGGYALFTATGNFIMPTGCSLIFYDLFGKGGNGGAGAAGTAGTARPGGSGGAGGARDQGYFPAMRLTPGTAYQVLMTTSSTVFNGARAYQGGDGVTGVAATNQTGGSGGSSGEFGIPGDSETFSPNGIAGGGHRHPNGIDSFGEVGQGQCGADALPAYRGLGADWGGASGGGSQGSGSGTGFYGGTSTHGGGGGAGGGGLSTINAGSGGGVGGMSGFYTDSAGNGGGAAGANGGNPGVAGGDAGSDQASGKGGGGGGAFGAGTGGAGGNGGIPSGGGGGGGGGSTGGAGGTGGRGEARIYYQ